MPINEVDIVRSCGECGTEIETVTIKKDNMMLSTEDEIWCPHCNESTPEVRDVAGRLETIRRETASYPKAVPASPFPKESTKERSD